MCADCEKALPNQIVFDKIESIIRMMQDEQNGLPVKTAKSFMSKIPSVFTGTDLIQWMMRNLRLEDQQEAVHLANLIASHGYIFPIEDHTLSIKNDCTFYRFQTPCLWPSQSIDPENTDYAVYLCKRTMQGKTRLELADYEAENLARLQKMFSRKWEFIFMQAEAQAKVDKKRDKLERKVLDSQERAFWDVYRPVPGCVNTTEMDIKKACRLSKSAKRCGECQKVAVAQSGGGGSAPPPPAPATPLPSAAPSPLPAAEPAPEASPSASETTKPAEPEPLKRSSLGSADSAPAAEPEPAPVPASPPKNQTESDHTKAVTVQTSESNKLNKSADCTATTSTGSEQPLPPTTTTTTTKPEAADTNTQTHVHGHAHHHHQHHLHHQHHHHHHPHHAHAHSHAHHHHHHHHHHHRQCPHHHKQQQQQQQANETSEETKRLGLAEKRPSGSLDPASSSAQLDRRKSECHRKPSSVSEPPSQQDISSTQSQHTRTSQEQHNPKQPANEPKRLTARAQTTTRDSDGTTGADLRPASACSSLASLSRIQELSGASATSALASAARQSASQKAPMLRKSSLNILRPPASDQSASLSTGSGATRKGSVHVAHPQLRAGQSVCGSGLISPIERQAQVGDLERELEALKVRLDRRIGGVKMSKVTQSYLSYFKQWAEYDPFIVQPIPSNPWISDSTELWDSERQTKDVHCRRVRRWTFSLKELLNDPAGREQFHRFLEKEFSAENLKFWDAVQELKRVHSKDVARRVEAIWTEYLAQDANCPINIDSKSYETSKRNMAKNKNNRYIFDEAAGHVYQLMKNDSYPRYLRSDMYKDYKELSERKRTNQVAFDVFKPQITTLKHKFNF